jgi:Kef-type K+ transport system membrane component KefB
MAQIQDWFSSLSLPVLLIIGIMTISGFYFGRIMKYIKLPGIIGFMVIGVILGPSVLNIVSETLTESLSFITEIALSFVAVSIGLELSFRNLRRQGRSIVIIILTECFLAFGLVSVGIYLLTGNLPLAIIFGAIAPASAPAGTVAIIQEYRARGPLTRALYSVLGFDDGLGIIIFGFAAAIAHNLISVEAGNQTQSFFQLIAPPLKEIGLSIVVGILVGYLFSLLARKVSSNRDIFVLLFAAIFVSAGLSIAFHLSHILTNMVVGLVIVNTQSANFISKIRSQLTEFMPLLFILFFVLAGANLHIAALPSLGLIGVVYIVCRTVGLTGGASLGATIGRAHPHLKKYLGMGILSQAGVAIGLALVVKNDFSSMGEAGALIGSSVITTITATSIFFELIGPITAKAGLKRAGEITTEGLPEDQAES